MKKGAAASDRPPKLAEAPLLVADGTAKHECARCPVIDGADAADAREFLGIGLVSALGQVVAVEADGELLRRIFPDDARVLDPIAVLEQRIDLRLAVHERIVDGERLARPVAGLAADRDAAAGAEVD